LPTSLTANLYFKTLDSNTRYKLSYFSKFNGGGERDRTDDPLLAKQVLSQLSYTPRYFYNFQSNGGSGWARTIDPRLIKTVL
jgi:hypothetical protein